MQTKTVTNSIPLRVRTANVHSKPKRGYHTGKANKKTPNGASEQFNIESVICGDGSRAASGMSLRNLTIYASERIDGGVESYYEVEPDSLVFSTRGGGRGGNWRTRVVTERAKISDETTVPCVNIPSAKRDTVTWVRKKLRESALRWLFMNRGCALSVGGPGARGSITGVEQYLVLDEGSTYEKPNDGNCVSAAITNAIDIVCGRETASVLREYFYDENQHYLKIREATLLLHDMGTDAEMRKIPKADRKAFNSNPFAVLASRKSRVYVVHFYEPKVTSHTVVIDASRGLIIDSAEDYPMRLSEEILRKCGGDHAKALRVGEVRMIVKQSTSNPNNHK